MERDVKSLQSQLDHEKSRFKKMQADLQKELLGAFEENTKLTALLDGKVPKSGCLKKKKKKTMYVYMYVFLCLSKRSASVTESNFLNVFFKLFFYFIDIMDSLVLEKTAAELKKELEKSKESERALQSKMEELKALEVLPAKVDDLLRQVRT